MKIEKEKIKVGVYGVRQNFRFSFTIRIPLTYDIETDVKCMMKEGRREAKRIFLESNKKYNTKYGGTLEKIKWLQYDNGLKIEVQK